MLCIFVTPGNVLCCCLKGRKREDLTGAPPYSQAFENNLLKGLRSYAIMENPQVS
jgi:hypothetical protein